jgi:transcriptional regulator with XRE-family HTH domain
MADRRITGKQLAERAGVSVTYISEIKNGKRNISIDTLLRLFDALDLELIVQLKATADTASQSNWDREEP